MPGEDFDSLCEKLYNELYDNLCRKDDEERRFAKRGTSKSVLHDRNLQRFLHSLVPSGPEVAGWTGVRDGTFIKRIKDRNLYDFLAILIWASCNINEARAFVQRLVALPTWGEQEEAMSRLPANRLTLQAIFQSAGTADKFFKNQACFCAVVLRKGEEVRGVNLSIQRLPIVSESSIGTGSFGHVSSVFIAEGHFYDPKGAQGGGFKFNNEDVEMARKDYITSEEFPRAGQKEHALMKNILGSSSGTRTCENIVDNWGSIEIAPNMYSLFMPKATWDLRRYMMEDHKLRPSNPQAKADIISGAIGLTAGLKFLHTGMKTPQHDDMVCYHMDLKPDNVLVFEDGAGPPVWKLSDFGMSRVKIREAKEGGGETEDNFNSWFVPRQRRKNKNKNKKQEAEASLSATLNRRNEGTYLAPESVSQVPSMTTKSDVWSLGCVVSVVFAYLDDGARGVDSYTTARLNHRGADGYDRFFVRGKFAKSRLNPEVSNRHSKLIGNASLRSPVEAGTLREFLKDLEAEALEIDQGARCDAARVEQLLTKVWKAYNTLEQRQQSSSAEAAASSKGFQLWRRQPEVRESETKVEAWPIASNENFKGCDISPDGTLVAYWTDKKISLYTSESLSRRTVEPVSHYELGEADSKSIWKSVSLTQRWLIASTTSSNFNV
jgi:serine/threonine protein kinase